MFSSDISWAPVAEIGSRTAADVGTAALKATPSRRASASRPSTRGATPTDEKRSLRTSVSAANLSVFRWGRSKTSYQQRQRAGSNSGTGVWISTESVVEVREESGPVQRHELPASYVFTASRQVRRLASLRATNPRATPPTSPTSPTSSTRPTETALSHSQPPISPSSSHGGKSGASDKQCSVELWRSTWRPPDEWGSSTKRSTAPSNFPGPDSSPRTTILSLTPSCSSVLDGLSPPPKSPGIPSHQRPNVIDIPPSRPPMDNIDALGILVRRMTSASPATRLHRATESWPGPLTDRDRDDIALEQSLWLLAELRSLDAATLSVPQATPSSSIDPPRPVRAIDIQRPDTPFILDVCSSYADLIQLAALQPGADIRHIAATETVSPLPLLGPLPKNVASVPLLMSPSEVPEFLLVGSTFHHARVTPAGIGSLSAPQLRELLQECYRVLVVGGTLEITVVDPTPVDVGPALAKWVDEELLLGLEARFRCTRPAALVPLGVRGAGLEMVEGGEACYLPLCVDQEASAEERLKAELGRWLLRSQYPFVEQWFWEVDKYMNECVRRGTKLKVVTMFAKKS